MFTSHACIPGTPLGTLYREAPGGDKARVSGAPAQKIRKTKEIEGGGGVENVRRCRRVRSHPPQNNHRRWTWYQIAMKYKHCGPPFRIPSVQLKTMLPWEKGREEVQLLEWWERQTEELDLTHPTAPRVD